MKGKMEKLEKPIKMKLLGIIERVKFQVRPKLLGRFIKAGKITIETDQETIIIIQERGKLEEEIYYGKKVDR